jgi:uncharacterized protein YfbU (UPF0304 family)
MHTVTVRISDEQAAVLESYAEVHRLSTSEVIRQALGLLVRGVSEPESGNRQWLDEVPASLGMNERKTLAMLFDQEARSTKDTHEKALHHRGAEALRKGFVGEYRELFGDIESELSLADSELVWDLLDMFRLLAGSRDALGDKERALIADIEDGLEFHGLDAAEPLEGAMLGYIRYLVEKGRWTEMAPYLDDSHEGGHSHASFLPSYKRMLAVFKPIWSRRVRDHDFAGRGFHLSAADLRKVAEAAPWRSGTAS